MTPSLVPPIGCRRRSRSTSDVEHRLIIGRARRLIVGASATVAYGIDVLSFSGTITAAVLMRRTRR